MFEVDVNAGTIVAYGLVGEMDLWEDSFGAKDFRKALKAMGGKDIELHLMSDGGEVHTGTSIANQIKNYGGKVTVVIDSLAASIASVIAVAADEVHIFKSAYMMVHNPWTVAIGGASEMREVADLLDKLGETIADFYAEKTGKSKDHWLNVMSKDTYFSGQEAIEAGIADFLIEEMQGNKAVARREPVAFATATPSAVSAKHKLRESMIWRGNGKA